jgi:hypothetical protein
MAGQSDSQPENGKARKKGDRDSGGAWSLGVLTVVLCLVLAGMMAFWHFSNRRTVGQAFGAEVEFVSAPDSVIPGVASRFVVQVAQDNEEAQQPLSGRVMDVTITPTGKAKILSVSGSSGQDYAIQGTRAKGRTDASGNLAVSVQVAEPGKYTLVATDSASLKEGTAEFRAVPRGG